MFMILSLHFTRCLYSNCANDQFPASLYPSVTSRKPKVDERDGQMYSFMTRSEMECDIKNGRFLEHGEYDGNLYGTKINSIHEVIETGKICILDVNPQVEEAHICALTFFHFLSACISCLCFSPI